MKQRVFLCKHCQHELTLPRAGMRLQEVKSWFRTGRADRTSWLPGHVLPEYPLHVALTFHNAEHEKEEKRDKSPEGSQSLAAATTSGVEEAKQLAVVQPPAQFVRQRA